MQYFLVAIFWLGIEECSKRGQNLVENESSLQKPVPEKWSWFMARFLVGVSRALKGQTDGNYTGSAQNELARHTANKGIIKVKL